ncbi:MAG: hypothetical protein J7578_16635 [Chitinophagaceae bacterium]|nr:hypothetical protein [Chitinophagaceae bacterium]
MNAAEFDIWIRSERTNAQQSNRSPESLSVALLERLHTDLNTWDNSVTAVVYTWRQFEAKQVQGSGVEKDPALATGSGTMQLINALLPLVQDRSLLQARLQSIKANLLLEYGALEEAEKIFFAAINHLTGLQLEVDVNRIYNMTIRGQVLLRLGQKQEAERIFLDVLSYPWYLVRETDVQVSLREYYISSAIGLIECRRGDLPALKNIFFVPATEYELKPILEEAIREATVN